MIGCAAAFRLFRHRSDARRQLGQVRLPLLAFSVAEDAGDTQANSQAVSKCFAAVVLGVDRAVYALTRVSAPNKAVGRAAVDLDQEKSHLRLARFTPGGDQRIRQIYCFFARFAA